MPDKLAYSVSMPDTQWFHFQLYIEVMKNIVFPPCTSMAIGHWLTVN